MIVLTDGHRVARNRSIAAILKKKLAAFIRFFFRLLAAAAAKTIAGDSYRAVFRSVSGAYLQPRTSAAVKGIAGYIQAIGLIQ